MPQPRIVRLPHPAIRVAPLVAVAMVVAGLVATGAVASPSASQSSAALVKRAQNKKLGHTILTNAKGRTLYSLSVEKNGTFICTDSSCLTVWHPLTVSAGTTPTGPVPLGTVTRPDGRIQVTYRGLPLYTFKGDKKTGQANGQGFKDVGTWRAAVAPKPKH